MMADKHFLHELLKEDQEPFHLKSYIENRRSQFSKPSSTTTLHLRKRNPIISHAKRSNLCHHACLFSFHSSHDVTKSPFFEFPSPAAARTPCKSPNAAAMLVEAAMRIQKKTKSGGQGKNGFGLFGSFLKRLKDRSRNKKRAIGNDDVFKEDVRVSCSCSNHRISSADWTENTEEDDKSLDSEASSTSSSEEINRFCSSPFRFSLHESPSYTGRRTPEFSSPTASPNRHIKKDEEDYMSRNSGNRSGEGEEKEQCSPVSILDPPFEDYDGNKSRDAEEDDYDHECTYENVQRAKNQLLYRLSRFENLAELDPMELERKLLDGSDDEELNCDDEAFEARNMKKLVSDLIVEENNGTINSGTNEVIMDRINSRFESWKEVEFNMIDTMIGLDLKREFDGWTKFKEGVNESVAEIEVGVFGVLMDELLEELVL